MTEMWREDLEDSRTIGVRIHRNGRLSHRELCESDEESEPVLMRWCELLGLTCEVDDLSTRHRAGHILEPEPADLPDEDITPEPLR
ncbi:hypothetical protein [Amycolatopsis orientalis]|uniref:hypothetical protein n=1 Tax=Amycolatopsis orientalis TaxID=31958 RepID=UPI00040FC155|nr:hypothetical protein [Amycolatopsis orientalis]